MEELRIPDPTPCPPEVPPDSQRGAPDCARWWTAELGR